MERGKVSNKKAKFTILRFENRMASELVPHSAALQPIADEDRRSVEKAIEEDGGVLKPLLVIEQNDPDAAPVQYLILDGVNRWEAVRKIDPDGMLPCQVIECDDPDEVVRECLSVGRKMTTGTKVICFLEKHKKQVLLAAREKGGRLKNLNNLSTASRERFEENGSDEWSGVAIAKELGVSKEDIRAGIDLLVCLEEKTLPKVEKAGGIHGGGAATEEYLAEVAKMRDLILRGSSPIRKWKAALAGKIREDGTPRQKADAQYGEHAAGWCRSLKNAMLHWPDFTENQRTRLVSVFSELVSALPRDLHGQVKEGIVKWSIHDRESLVKDMEKSLNQERKKGR
jgi:hypothetical protein